MPRRLRRIHQKQHAPPTAHRAGSRDILLKPQDVGHVRHRDQPRSRGQRSLDLLRMNAAVRVRWHKRERDDAASRQFRKRAQNGIVLHQCGNHVVARIHRAVNRHIERVSRVLRKSDAACVRLAQHLGDMLPAYFDNPPRRQRKPVPRASRICPACFQRVRHCLHRAARLWKARRRVIQINQAHSPFSHRRLRVLIQWSI